MGNIVGNNWYECALKHEELHHQTAKITKFKNTYLIDAMSYTEAEARMIEKTKEFENNIYEIIKLNPIKIEQIVDENDEDKWFKVKTITVDIDEKGKVKKIPSLIVMRSSDAEDAIKLTKEKLKGSVLECYVSKVEEYNLTDYYPYNQH
jgi:hypothetical protein